MDQRPEDHNGPGMLGHDLPPLCHKCGWLETCCHCPSM